MQDRYSNDDFLSFLIKVIDLFDDPIFVKNSDYDWIFVNDAFCNLLQSKKEHLLGKSDFEFFPKEEAEVFRRIDKEVFSTGIPNKNEEYLTDAEGVRHTLLTSKFRYSMGNDFILIGQIKDITQDIDFKEAQQKIATLKEHVLEEEISRKNREILSLMTMREQLKSAFSIIDEQLEKASKDKTITFDEIRKKMKSIETESEIFADNWNKFRMYFEYINPEFFTKLKKLEPNLTIAEMKQCSYMKLGLTNKDVARLLHVSPKAIEVARYRIKLKLGLSSEQRITKIIQDL